MATKWIGLRAGSDIAFLGGIANYILQNDLYFDEYVKNYTNAPVIIDQKFADTEDLDGLFSGWDPEKAEYEPTSWSYEGMETHGAAGNRETKGHQTGHGGAGAVSRTASHPQRIRSSRIRAACSSC